jgi:hypothetical protein
MKRRYKIVLASLVTIMPLMFYIASSRPPNMLANGKKIEYATMTPKKGFESCLEVPFRTEIKKIFIISSKSDKSPRGLLRQIYHVAVLAKQDSYEFYGHQILVKTASQCLVPFSGLGQDSPPISWSFSEKESQSYALAWHTWRLKNVPNEKKRVQKLLNSAELKMPKEDYIAYSKLGFKMPKKWQEVK